MSQPGLQQRQMTREEILNAKPGEIFEWYQRIIPWLQPEFNDASGRPTTNSGCKGTWQPVKQGWTADNTEGLWRAWEKLLPLFADPSVEEVFVQRVPRHPSDPTPMGHLDVLSSGMLGDRIHLHLRMSERQLRAGFDLISQSGVYDKTTPKGLAIIASPLDSEGVRLMGGVPPASVAPFAAIRIPSRERPDLEHLLGARRFGAGLELPENQILLAVGEPLPIPEGDPLAEAVATLDSLEKPEGRVMLPKAALEYLRGVAVAGWNPVFSGATSSAKTTMLNACLKLWPRHWRTVTVETSVAELRLDQINWVPLFSNEEFRPAGEPNELSQEGILRAAMRLSPKPIPTGEVRASDGALWAHLVSTGHEASPVTLHAGSTDEALMRLVQMILAGPDAGQLTEASAKIKAALAANVVFQLARDEAKIDGKIVSIRRCTSITEIQTEGSFMEGSFQIKLVRIFETKRDDRGEPELVYVGKDHCNLWKRLRARYQEHMIPDWANRDGVR